MHEKLRRYMETIFADAPQTVKTVELKEEILQNLSEKYNDLLAEGKTEEAAYNIAVASVGDVSDLLASLQNRDVYPTTDVMEAARKRSAVFVAVAVALYILSVTFVIMLADLNVLLGVVLMLILIAVATGLLIFNSMTKPRYMKEDETLVEEFKEWKEENSRSNQVFRAVSGAIWLLAVTVYMIVSFLTMAWHITWVIFPLAGAVNSIVKAVFDLKK